MLNPLLFQDDIARMCDSVEAAQYGNELVNHVMETKLLDFSKKSVYIVVGNKAERKNMKKKLEENPLTLAGVPMKEATQEKYLGDQIHMLCNAESVLATVKSRAGQVSAAIFEIRSVIEDCRADTIGGVMAGINIWEISVVPYLLNNSSVWGEVPKKALEILNNLQNNFYRNLLGTPRSTPIPALLWETGGLTMVSRINKMKLLFYHHLMSLDCDAVASKVARNATQNGYPGLIREYIELCMQYNLPCVRKISKQRWKRLVNAAILKENKTQLLQQIQTKYKKLDYEQLKHENYEVKEYFKNLQLGNARLKFRIRTKMVENIALNFSSDPAFVSRLWRCTHCDHMDSQSHVLVCSSYKYLRQDRDLSSDHPCIFFTRTQYFSPSPTAGTNILPHFFFLDEKYIQGWVCPATIGMA